jgi:HAD superfamily hydrolase (TIGR01509 family)
MTAIRAVVFDLDGVLVLSEHLWEEGWSEHARAHGYSWTAADTRHCQGLSVPEWAAYLGERSGTSPDEAAEAVIGMVARAYETGRVSLLDGALETVTEVARMVPTGLATSAPRRIIEIVLARMGLAPHLRVTVSTAEVARGKPHPDVYLEAMRRLGLPPAAAVAVEDSSNGVRAAAAAGLRVICLEHERYPVAPDARALAVDVVETLAQVRERLRHLVVAPASDV